jgi:hypothetical protein
MRWRDTSTVTKESEMSSINKKIKEALEQSSNHKHFTQVIIKDHIREFAAQKFQVAILKTQDLKQQKVLKDLFQEIFE